MYHPLINTSGSAMPLMYVGAEIQFGTPSKKCEGMGICRMQIMAVPRIRHASRRERRKALALLFSGESNHITIYFLKEKMNIDTQNRYFTDSPKFFMEEEFNLPFNILQSLDLYSSTIQIGHYPIYDGGDAWIVTF